MGTSSRRPTRLSDEACVSADAALVRAFDLLGRRWTGVVLGTLSGGPAGFRALARAIEGISDSMLADRLAPGTAPRLLARPGDQGPPGAGAYELTGAGRARPPAPHQNAPRG